MLPRNVGHACEGDCVLDHLDERVCCHVSLEPPGEDEPCEVVHHCAQVVEAPSSDSEVGSVGGSHLVRTRSLRMELLASGHFHLRTLYQSLTIEEPLNGGF